MEHTNQYPLELNETLSSIWRSVLVVDSVQEHDNFFSLGGHSLLAIELINQIEEKLQVQLNMRDIVEFPSLSEIALIIQERRELEKLLKFQQEVGDHRDSYPLSLNQKQVWSLNALYPDSKTHNISTALRVKKPLSEDLLTLTVNFIVNRQEALRTNFKILHNTPVQEITPERTFDIRFEDVSEENLIPRLYQEMNYSFNLESDNLMRIKFFRLNPSEYVFFFMIHHIVWDGLSNTMFFHEFNACYKAFEEGMIPELPEIRMTLKEHALAEAKTLTSEEFQAEKREWKQILSDPLPVLNLKTDFPRTESFDHELGTIFFEIQGDELTQLENYAQKKHLSLYNVLLAAYNVVLAKETGNLDLIIGTPVHGRNSRDVRKTFGYFINTLPIRTKLSPTESFNKNLSLVLESLKTAFYHQNVPLDVLLQIANASSERKQTSLFQTLFIYLDVTKELDVFDELKFEQIKIERLAGHTEVDFYLYKSRSKIEGVIEYRKNLFAPETMQKLAQTFKEIVARVVADESLTLTDLGVITTQAQKAPSLKVQTKTRSSTPKVQTSTSLEVSEIWRNIIGLSEVDPDENFFNIGGHSILAVEIFNIINERFDIELPISAIFEAATVNQLSSLIDQELLKNKPYPAFKSVVTIKTAPRHKQKIFCFHGVGGNVLNYYSLGSHVGDKAFFGIQSQGVTGDDLQDYTMAQMASSYIEEIRVLQPHGPYLLAGGSMGGMMALEVAQQLKIAGQEVSEIIMFDTFGPKLNHALYGRVKILLWSRVVERLKLKKEDLKLKLMSLWCKLRKKPLPQNLRYQLVQKRNLKALSKYQARAYAGSITLFRAPKRPKGWYADPYLGWKETITGRITVIEVDGSHDNFIESAALAQAFASRLVSLH